MTEFDPAAHRMVPQQRWFEDFVLGERFVLPSRTMTTAVFADDTIYPALEVTELLPGRSTGVVSLRSAVFNQRRELVLEGLQKFLIRRRSAEV